jgi:hypothetical protein
MSGIYKSARGKSIDIDKIKLAQETTIAVGNMKVNARGDKIGAGGEIVSGRNQIMDEAYAINNVAPPYSPNDPSTFKQHQNLVEANKAKELHDLSQNLIPTVTEQEAAVVTNTPPARGSLAATVAKPATVIQQPAPRAQEQKKSQGPSRI